MIISYFHNHLQDNVLASAVWAVPGYLWGRYHLKKIHRRQIEHHLQLKARLDRLINEKENKDV